MMWIAEYNCYYRIHKGQLQFTTKHSEPWDKIDIPDNSKLVEFLGGDWDTVVRLADSHVL